MRRDPAPGREERAGLTAGALASTSPGGGWRLGADEAAGQIVAGPLTSCGGTERKHGFGWGQQEWESGYAVPVAHALRAEGFDASEDGTGRGTPIVPVAFAENSRAELRLEGGDGQTISALKTGGGKPGQSYPAVAFGISSDCFDRSGEGANGSAGERSGLGIIEEASATIRAKRPNAVAQSMSVRRLLPEECEILQGFPPGFTDVSFKGKPAADGNRYRALGNSMAVPVLRWILSRIEAQSQSSHSRAAQK